MATFTIVVVAEVNDNDQDVMLQVPEAIQNRFDGTAVRIQRITVTKKLGDS